MKHLIKKSLLALLIILSSSCDKEDDDEVTPTPTTTSNQDVVTANDFSVTIDENPLNGSSIGFISASTNNNKTLNYSWYSISPQGLDINVNTGELTVSDSSYFDYEQNAVVSATFVAFIKDNSTIFDTAQVKINLTNVVEINEMAVQQRLNNGQTPFEIYQSDNSLLDSLYGKTYEGGMIFYLNTNNGNGLVAAQTDQSTGVAWDTTTNISNQTATGATSKAIGDGASNTSTIITALSSLGMYAAQVCDNLTLNSKSDWFLPSDYEMKEMYENLQVNGIGGFANARYWTSTEFDLSPRGAALYRDFDTSTSQTSGTAPKVAQYHVRAARAF